MNRKNLVNAAAKRGLIAALALFVIGQLSANAAPIETTGGSGDNKQAGKANSLKPPAQGQIPVAFVISDGAVIIDFCGPWEVFRDVNIPGLVDGPFRLYTVSDTTSPIHAGGGMQIIPDYTFANAPAPKVIVIPAQSKPSEAMLKWIRESTKNTDVTMSVCTGAFVLAKTDRRPGPANRLGLHRRNAACSSRFARWPPSNNSLELVSRSHQTGPARGR